ncbi:MAG: hypothetical protein PHG05_02785 [Candidatus Nanoarchaeia archaeon]|nr:hypothetical protein [Candidatus Nanoarchaeia archaeon]
MSDDRSIKTKLIVSKKEGEFKGHHCIKDRMFAVETIYSLVIKLMQVFSKQFDSNNFNPHSSSAELRFEVTEIDDTMDGYRSIINVYPARPDKLDLIYAEVLKSGIQKEFSDLKGLSEVGITSLTPKVAVFHIKVKVEYQEDKNTSKKVELVLCIYFESQKEQESSKD